MRTRILTTDEDLNTFARRFRQRGNPVSLEYLQQCQVRGFFTEEGVMFAGYALNLVRPLRYEQWIPEENRGVVTLLANRKKVCELTCIWIYGNPGRASSERIYLKAVTDALFSGAQFVLGGTVSPVVFGIQTQTLSQLLYTGYTEYFGKRQPCWIYGASRIRLLGSVVTFFPIAIVRKTFGRPNYLAKARARAKALAAQTTQST